jgi:thiamine pyrophosphokinase
MKAIIVSGGKAPSKELIIREMELGCIILCADSGADYLHRYGIIPHYLMGDFDSIDKNILEYYRGTECTVERFPKEKDFTDTQLALFKAIECGVSKVVFLGCTGSRVDHTLGNITLLLQCLEKNIEGYIADDNNLIYIVNKPIELRGRIGENLSFLAYNAPVSNLCISGAKYELNNYYLEIGDPLTLSNEFLKEIVNVSFTSGKLLVMRSRD